MARALPVLLGGIKKDSRSCNAVQLRLNGIFILGL